MQPFRQAELVHDRDFNQLHREGDAYQYQAKLLSVGRYAIFFMMKFIEKGEKPTH